MLSLSGNGYHRRSGFVVMITKLNLVWSKFRQVPFYRQGEEFLFSPPVVEAWLLHTGGRMAKHALIFLLSTDILVKNDNIFFVSIDSTA